MREEKSRLIKVTLYYKGDDLDPVSVSNALQVLPSYSHKKGDKKLTSTQKEVIYKTGVWSLKANTVEDNLSAHIKEILSQISIESLKNIKGIEDAYIDIYIDEADDVTFFQFEIDSETISSIAEKKLELIFTVTKSPVE